MTAAGAAALLLSVGCHSSHGRGSEPSDEGRAITDASFPDAREPHDGGGGDPMPGSTHAYHVEMLDLARPLPDPGVVPGFDLDGIVSSGDDPRGCHHEDYVSPPPDRIEGVDNQLGPLLSSTTVDVAGPIARAIDSGELRIDLVLRRVDSFTDDPDVGLTIVWQDTEHSLEGRIEGGRLIAGGAVVGVRIPLGGAWVDLRMTNIRIRLTPTVDAVRLGVVGGFIDKGNLVDALVASSPRDFSEDVARSIVWSQADLAPTPAGVCEAISTAFVFEGRAR